FYNVADILFFFFFQAEDGIRDFHVTGVQTCALPISYFNKTIQAAQDNWRKVVALAAEHGIPAPTFASSLAYYDGYRSARLPANLDRKSTRLNSSHVKISYAVFCLKKKKKQRLITTKT